MKNNKFEKGDKVKVWSLQSFSGGGFLNGEEAYVRQDQYGASVILIVPRNINGEIKIDEAYEVYGKQCELIEENHIPTIKEKLLKVVKRVLKNNNIK